MKKDRTVRGYKVVMHNCNDELVSAYVNYTSSRHPGMVVYTPGTEVVPNKGCGPLCILKTAKRAACMCELLHKYDWVEVWLVEGIESKRRTAWFEEWRGPGVFKANRTKIANLYYGTILVGSLQMLRKLWSSDNTAELVGLNFIDREKKIEQMILEAKNENSEG